jgi:antibiotic biosynthesis monooxygenase (ABM) superfamily enzyme
MPEVTDPQKDEVNSASGNAARPPGPVPRYKMAVIIWLAIYPALTITLVLLSPLLAPLPLVLRTLVLTALLVPIMVYVLLPAMQRLFAAWLHPSDANPAKPPESGPASTGRQP